MKNREVIAGIDNVISALRDGKPLSKILIRKGLSLDVISDLRSLSKQFGIPMQIVPDQKLDKLARGKHQGVAALASIVSYYRLEDVLPMIYERGEVPLFLALDGVTDVRNVGAIARTAFGAGVHGLIVPPTGTAPLGADAEVASAGTLSKVTVCRQPSIHGAVSYLQLNGIKVCCAHSKGKRAAHEVDLTHPACLVVGDEETGVSAAVLKKADELIRLPISAELDSYNVSVAVGMLLYEVMRQRN
jgi:23S rRNA (guanosine2251-2'-O)-methyltransferase